MFLKVHLTLQTETPRVLRATVHVTGVAFGFYFVQRCNHFLCKKTQTATQMSLIKTVFEYLSHTECILFLCLTTMDPLCASAKMFY